MGEREVKNGEREERAVERREGRGSREEGEEDRREGRGGKGREGVREGRWEREAYCPRSNI